MTPRTPLDLFVEGASKGWAVGTNSIIPNLVMAFALMEILKLIGVLEWIGKLFGPLMSIFNLPGETITVLLTSWVSMAAGVGITVSLYKDSIITNTHVTILIVAIYLMGAQIQYMGRLLGVSAVPKRYWPLLFVTCIINALIAMFVMKFIA